MSGENTPHPVMASEMTLRDVFACHVMAAMVGRKDLRVAVFCEAQSCPEDDAHFDPPVILDRMAHSAAIVAYDIADILVEARGGSFS